MTQDHIVEDDFVLIDSPATAAHSASSPPVDTAYSLPIEDPIELESPKYLPFISNIIDEELSPVLRLINLAIHDNPELNYHEYHAHDLLVKFLSKRKGWKVQPHAYDIETAFIAVYDSGRDGPVVGFNVEYGKLPGMHSLELSRRGGLCY